MNESRGVRQALRRWDWEGVVMGVEMERLVRFPGDGAGCIGL